MSSSDNPGASGLSGGGPETRDTGAAGGYGDPPDKERLNAASAAERCIWPGCPRLRAPGRASGSGRQKEYCLQADPPERGGGPVHNARNRWAALRNAGSASHDLPAGDRPGGFPAAQSGEPPAGQGAGDGEPGPFSGAKKRAAELLEQAKRQHAAALAGLRAERELYQRFGEELAVLADPAALDLEIATVAARAGRQVAQAEQDAADARRAQLAAERERDEEARLRTAADDAAEQLAEDTAEAERVLAERTAGFENDLAAMVARARTAEEAERAARDDAAAAAATAQAAVAAARDRAEQSAAALADALLSADRARQETARVREQATAAAAAAETRARHEAAAAQARADDLVGQARADAERERETARQARDETARARGEAEAARESQAHADARTAAARSDAATAAARAGSLEDELARARAELARRDAAHAAELARLSAAHQAALDAQRSLLGAERAKAHRAEEELAAARAKK